MKKYTLITGASMGIGKALACDFASKGENLVLVARSVDRLNELAGELRRSGNIDVRVFPADLAEQAGAERIFRYCTDNSLVVDTLVNCAGFSNAGSFAGMPREELRQMTMVNMVSLAEMTRLFLPVMIGRGRGTIVNIASIGGFQGVPYMGLYSATKSFVITFTEAINEEIRGTGVRIYAVCPGFIDTNFYSRAGHDRKRIVLPISRPDVVTRAVMRGMGSKSICVFPTPLDWLLVVTQRLMPRRVVIRLGGFFAGAGAEG